jgi:hypothetical protein
MKIEKRIYHDDTLLSNRATTYLAANAFLVIAFATIIAASPSTGSSRLILELAIIFIGMFMALGFTTIGRRSVIAIQFWRECSNSNAPVRDGDLFKFFRDGIVVLPDGTVISRKRPDEFRGAPGTIGHEIPWRWGVIGTPNNALGVILPLCLASFWAAASFTVSAAGGMTILTVLIPTAFVFGTFISIAGLSAFAVMMATWSPQGVSISAPRTLLAVLGRGIQYDPHSREDPEGWIPSPDYETCTRSADGKPIHSALTLKEERGSSNWVVGGGQLNVDAAVAILRRTPMPCALGFAHPADYLRKYDGANDGPSESEPMERALKRALRDSIVIPYSGIGIGASNTRAEVENVMKLAKERRFEAVRFLTISPHVPRVSLYAQSAKLVKFSIESAETVLLSLEPDQAERIRTLQSSVAYRNTISDERFGIADSLDL